MRLDGDGKALKDVFVYLTPAEARELINVLESLLAVVPSREAISHSHVDDGERELTLHVYADPQVENEHDHEFRFFRGPGRPLEQ